MAYRDFSLEKVKKEFQHYSNEPGKINELGKLLGIFQSILNLFKVRQNA